MLGMRFKIGDDSHYAWIRLSVGMAATSITIEEYAWDDQANIGGITAGITAPVPEPALASAIQCWTDGQAVLVQRPEEWQVHYSPVRSARPAHSVYTAGRSTRPVATCNSGSGWHIPGSDQLSRTRYSNQENISGVRILARL